ncbi:uncharacterized protein LOC101734336 [Xenopus tropicalis]|uniref:Uncharacterized protein LOC101734336 n=1 Tax=Xenopus tropicalis TaxID=8364 RepID=A0A8J0R7T1_XENTR|nr:uncharacterized protein LOC101734336 [Xenopus tropicalis]
MQETKEQNTDTLQKLNEQLQDEEQLIAFSANLIKDVLQGLCLAGQHQTSLLPAESSVGENDQLTHVIYNEKSDPSIEEAKELPVERESLSAVGPTEEEILVREAEKSLNQDEPNNVQEVECLNLRDQLQKTELNNDQTNDEESMELLQQELSLDQPRNVAQSEEANRFLTEICVKEQSLPQLEDEDLQAYPLNEEAFTSKEDLTSGKGEKDQILSGENAEYTEERCTAKLPNTTGSSETHQELHWIPKPQLLNTYVDLDFMNSGNEVAFSKEDRANITSDGEEHIQEETDFAASTGEPSEEIETLPKSVSPTQDEETCKISAEFIVISNDEESMELLQQKLSLDQPRNVAQSEEPNRFLTEIFVKEQSLPQLEDEDLQAYPLNEETFTPKEDLTSGKGEKDQILYKTQNEEGSAGEIYKHISHLATELHDSSLVEKFQSQTFEEDIHFQTMVDFYRDSKREESFEQIDHSNKVEQSRGTYDISTQDTFTSQIQSTFSGENAEYTEERCTAKLPNTTGSSETHQELHWIPKPQLLNTYVDLDFMNSGNEVAFSEEDRSNITSDRLGEEHIQEETDFTASTGEPSEEIETLPKSVSPTQDEETCKTSAEFIVISKENVGVLSHLSSARSPFSDEETERGSDLVGVMQPLHKEINIIKPADDLRESMKVMGELSDVEPEITQTHSLDDANKLATLEESQIFTMTNQLQVGKEEQDGEKAAAFSKEPQTEISKMDILLKSIKEVQDKETLHTTHHLEETKHVVISDENVMELNISPMEDETESNIKDLEESLKEINMLLNVQTEMTVNHSEDVRETTGEGSQYFTIPGQSQQLVGEEDILQKEENHYINAHCTEPSEPKGGSIEPEDNLRDISESENELDMLSNRVNEEPPTLEEVQSLSTSEQSLVGEEDILEEKSLPTDQPTEVNEREILTNSTQEDKTLNTTEAMESIEISNDHFIDPSKELHLNSISSQIEDETEDIIEHPPEEEKDIITPADNLTDFHGSQKELNLLSDVLPNIATNYPAEHCKETYVEQATLEEEPEGQSQPCVSEENISEETDKSTSEDQPTVIERDSEIQVEENLQPSDNLEETKTIVIPGEIFMDLSEELFLPVANSLVIDNEKERLYDQTEQTSQEERNVLKLDDNISEKELYVVSDVHTNVTQSHTAEDVIAWKSHDWGEPIMEAIAMEQTHSFKGYIEDQDAPVEEGEVSVSDLLPKAEFILIPDVKPIELDNPDSLSRGGGSERATKDTLGIMSVSPLVGIVITTDHESSEDKNSSEMKCSSEEDAIDGNDVVHMSTNQKGEHLEAAILSVPEKSLVANPDLLSEVGGDLKAKETLSDQEEGTLLPHNTLDLSAQKSRVILRRKTSIRKRPRQTLPDPETIEQPPPPVFRPLAMGVPVFPVKLPIIAPLHPKPTPPPAEVHKEEKPPTEGLAVQPKKVMPRHAGFGVPHPQMMQELQNRLLKKKPKQ